MHGPTSGSIWASMGPLSPPRLPNISLSALPEIPLGHCHLLSPPSSLSFAHTAGSSGSLTHFPTFPFVLFVFFFCFFPLFSESVIPPIPRGSCFCMELQRLIQSSFDPFFLPTLRLASMGTRCFLFFSFSFHCFRFLMNPSFIALCSDTPSCIPPPFVFHYLRRFVIFCNFRQHPRSPWSVIGILPPRPISHLSIAVLSTLGSPN